MEWYALTHLGAEEALRKELAALGVPASTQVGGCSFEGDDAIAAKVLWRAQAMTRLLKAVAKGALDDLDLARAHELIPQDETFRASCDVIVGGPQDLTSTEIAAQLGGRIERPVDLEQPQHDLYCQAGPVALCGLDVAGDLSRRYYRIFTNRRSVKGSFAAALLWLRDFEGGLLDPFANTGEIPIEAAMRSAVVSHRSFQKHERLRELGDVQDSFTDQSKDPESMIWCVDPELGNLRSCKKNAKLAGVEKAMSFSKLDPEWMDVKFDEAQIGAIITIPPPITKRNPDPAHIKELCYQAEFILKKGGLLMAACMTPETAQEIARHAKTYKLEFIEDYVIYSGQLPVQVVCYGL